MANKYGEAALIAARLDVAASVSAAERWDVAVRQLHPGKPYLQRKSAPKAAFLGLCAAGRVRGVAEDAQAAVSRDGAFAIGAADLLKAGTQRSVTGLWAAVTAGEKVEHGAQMDVVLALWKNGLII